MKVLQETVVLLSPFEFITNEISGVNYVTSSLVIAVVVGLHNKITRIGEKLEMKPQKSFSKN